MVAQPAPQLSQLFSGPGIWHVVESTVLPGHRPAILRGSRSIWCGKYNPCWANPVGYPDFAYEVLYVDTGPHSMNYTLNLCMITSSEVFYDHLYLVGGGGGATDPIGSDTNALEEAIGGAPSGSTRLLTDWTGTIGASTPGAHSIDTTAGPVTISGSNSGEPDSLSASITIASGHRALYFVFKSDCLYSSEDSGWPFGHGVLLDDLVTSDNGEIYTDAAATGGTDAFGGSVIAGTPGAPIISSRGLFRLNQSPSITSPLDQTRTAGESIVLTATATDPDASDVVQMSAFGYPVGLGLTSSSGNPASVTLSGTLSCATVAGSPYTILWCATSLFYDVNAATVLTVGADPHAPVVTAPATVPMFAGSVVTFQVYASDPDGDAISSLTADLTNLPPGNNAVFSPVPGNHEGSFTWATVPGNEGDYSVRFTASNALQGCMVTQIHILPDETLDVALDGQAPSTVSLGQNRPNPFNPVTFIHIGLPRETHVVLRVFDIQGRRVVDLLDRVLPSGPREVSWDGRDAGGRDAPAGIYLYRMEAAGVSLSRRMVLLR